MLIQEPDAYLTRSENSLVIMFNLAKLAIKTTPMQSNIRLIECQCWQLRETLKVQEAYKSIKFKQSQQRTSCLKVSFVLLFCKYVPLKPIAY